MTDKEAIDKLKYLKKAYQMLIDEKVDRGKLVGRDITGEWKADTPLDEAYKSMIEALDLTINALEQQPSEDCISRQAVLKELGSEPMCWTDSDAELQEINDYRWFRKIIETAKPVKPKYTDEEIDKIQAVEQAYVDKMVELAVEEVRRPKGKWIRVVDKAGHWVWECDCKWQQRFATNFCPNCGAEMSGGGEDEAETR